MRNFASHLTFWVLLAIVAGGVLGYVQPEWGVRAGDLGKYFIEVVKLFIAPLIFLTITLGIAEMGDLKRVGIVGAKALIYFEVVTTLALLIGIAVAYIVKPGHGITNDASADIAKYTQRAAQFTWAQFLRENVTIQVLFLSIASGIGLNMYQQNSAVVDRLQSLSKYVFTALKYVMYAAPIGAFGGMAFTIGKYGLHSLVPLAKLMMTVYVTMAVFIFGVLWAIMRYYGVSLWRFLGYIRQELLLVLGTSSSESALPSLMEKLERMGCSKPVVGLVVPAGYSFNMDGTTIYLSMATMFLAQVYNVDLTWAQMLTVIGVLMVTSKGAAGVTGAGFVVLASTLSAVQVIPVEGLALLVGVDRFMSEARSITNFIGNGVAAIWVSNHEGDFDRSKMQAVMS